MFARILAAPVLLCLLMTQSAGAVGKAVDDANEWEKEQAQRKFKEGAARFEAGRWQDAVTSFRASFEIVASPNTRVMLGRSLRKAGQLVEAYNELRLAADDAKALAARFPKYEQAAQTALVELAEIHVDVAVLNVEVKGGSEPVRLRIGNRSIARAYWSAIPVLPGEVEIVVTTADRNSSQRVKAVAANELPVKFDFSDLDRPLARLGPAMSPSKSTLEVLPTFSPESNNPDTSAGTEPTSLKPWAFLAAGVGAAGLVTFGVAGSMAQSTESDLEDACPNDNCPPDLEEKADDGRTQQTIANIGLAVGAVGLGAAVTLFIVDSSRSSSETARAPKNLGPSVRVVANPFAWSVRGEF